jgi:hypothetical protein
LCHANHYSIINARSKCAMACMAYASHPRFAYVSAAMLAARFFWQHQFSK